MGSWVPTRDPVSLARSAMKLQNSPVLGCLPCPNPHSLALCLLQIRAEPRPPFSLEIITGWFRRVSRCQRVPSYLPSPKRLFLCGFGTGAQRAAPACAQSTPRPCPLCHLPDPGDADLSSPKGSTLQTTFSLHIQAPSPLWEFVWFSVHSLLPYPSGHRPSLHHMPTSSGALNPPHKPIHAP